MSGFALFTLRAAGLALLFLTASVGALPAQDRVGVSSAVNPEAAGAPPGAASRRLVIGQDVVFNEHITTGATGQTQLLFLDESSMSVGPNSDLTIDQFVYDPKSGTGKLAMSATRGLLRYVGGKLSKQDEAVTLRTSTATLAVRGGAFIAQINSNGTVNAVFLYGTGLTVTGSSGATQTLIRPGFQSTTGPDGQPSPPGPQPPGQLTLFTQQLDGQPGGTGGATNLPTDTSVVNSGLPQTLGSLLPQNLGSPLNPTNPNATPPTVTLPSSGGQIVNCTVANSCPPGVPPVGTTSSGQLFGGSNGTGGAVVVTYAGRVKNTNGNGTARGFVDESANGDSAYSSGTLKNGVFTATIANSLGTVSFPLAQGSASFGPAGTASALGTFSGTTFLSADGTFFFASLTPTSAPTQRAFIYGGTPVSSTALQQTGSTRILAFTVQPDAALQSNIPFIRAQAGGNLSNATVSPFYVAAPPNTAIGSATTASAARGLQASLAVSGQGANQQSAIAVTTGTFDAMQSNGQPLFNGRLRGSSLQSASGTPVALDSHVTSTVDGNGNSIYGGSAISGFVLDQNSATGAAGSGIATSVASSTASETTLSGTTASYGFTQAALPVAVPSGVGTTRTTQTLTGNFGGVMYTTAQATPYIVTGDTSISTDAPNNRIQATLSGNAQTASSGANTLTMQYGALTGNAGGREAFIDDNNFGVLESQVNPQQINGANLVVAGDTTQAGKLYLVNANTAGMPTSLLPSGTAYCQCQFLQWGYWGGGLLTGNSIDSSISRVDAGHINTWVAGVPTPLGDLNTLMTASATGTYTGHAIGSVFNNGSSYLAAGGFTGTYNFGTQSGTVAVSNFDGHNFSASGSAPLTGANYTFNVSSAAMKGTINGTFYGPKAAETGGSFAVQATVGPTYLASGIFAGKK